MEMSLSDRLVFKVPRFSDGKRIGNITNCIPPVFFTKHGQSYFIVVVP